MGEISNKGYGISQKVPATQSLDTQVPQPFASNSARSKSAKSSPDHAHVIENNMKTKRAHKSSSDYNIVSLVTKYEERNPKPSNSQLSHPNDPLIDLNSEKHMMDDTLPLTKVSILEAFDPL